MADDIPAGWYPDIHGTVRWWDGERWTDRVRDTSATPTSPPAPVEDVRTPAATAAEVTGANGTPTYATHLGNDEPAEDARQSEEPQVRNPLERYASETCPPHTSAR